MFLIKPTRIFKKDLFVKDFIYKTQTNVCELLHTVASPLDQPALRWLRPFARVPFEPYLAVVMRNLLLLKHDSVDFS